MENTKHPHKGHRQRVKEKARKGGIFAWPQHEIMELLLMYSVPYKDVNPLAHKLIDTFGSLAGVLDAGYEHLTKISGIGKETALYLSLLPQFFKAYKDTQKMDPIIMGTPQQCAKHFNALEKPDGVEILYIFCLDGRNRLLKTIRIDNDCEKSVSVSLSDFATQISFKGNKSLVIMHNHPNGDPNPTDVDVKSTNRLINAARMVGIRVADHVIVAGRKYFSFNTNNMMPLNK